jgi:hypothetical protein
MLRLLVLLLSAGPLFGQPVLKELSPRPPAPKVEPPPGVNIPVDAGKYRYYSVDGYAGPVTWIVKGVSVGVKEVEKPLTMFGVIQGFVDPGQYDVPAGAVIVWGKSEGVTDVQALGIVKDKPVILLSLAFQVGPAPPKPDDPKPDDPKPKPPQPVTSFRVIFVRETKTPSKLTAQQSAVSTADAVVKYLRAKTTAENSVPGYREYDPDTNASNDQPGFQKLWAAAQAEAQKSRECIVIQVNDKVTIEPWSANTAAALKLLKQYGGE